MAMNELTTVVSSDRRSTIVNLKQVSEIPLRNALQSFDKNGDGKIDISELQKIVYWYGLWKYASIGLCMVIMLLIWSTFGLTIWAINLTKEYTVTGGVLTGGDEVVKMSVASSYIPLSWATLLDRRHLDSLDSVTIDVTQSSGKFSSGVYHVKIASYLHANSTYLKLFGTDGSRVWINTGTVVLHHPDANEAIMVCGAAACNTLAVDVKPDYLQQLVQRSTALYESNRDFELPATVDGVAINKADGEDTTCMARWGTEDLTNVQIMRLMNRGGWAALEKGSIAYNNAEKQNMFKMWYGAGEMESVDLTNIRDNGGKTDEKDFHKIVNPHPVSVTQQQIERNIDHTYTGDHASGPHQVYDHASVPHSILVAQAQVAPEIVLKHKGNVEQAAYGPDWLVNGVQQIGTTKTGLHDGGSKMEGKFGNAFQEAAAKTREDVEKAMDRLK